MKGPVAAAALLLSVCSPAWGAWQIILPQGATETETQETEAPAARDRRASADKLGPAPDASGSECVAFVRKGDSLATIARRILGDTGRWREIQKLNNIENPDMIGSGWKLAMPCEEIAENQSAPSANRQETTPPAPGSGAAGVVTEAATAADIVGMEKEIEAAGADSEDGADSDEVAAGMEKVAGLEENREAGAGGEAAPAELAGVEASPGSAPADGADEPPALADACSVTIGRGDSLAILASRHLGDDERWPEIQELNNIPDPDVIAVGQTLRLPCSPDDAGTRIAGAGVQQPGAELQQEGAGAQLAVQQVTAAIPAVMQDSGQPGLPRDERSGTWTASAGERLDDVISRWAISAGWTPIITRRWSWEFDTDVTVSGTFLEGVRELLSGFSSTGEAPGVAVYANQVLVLEYR